MPVSYGKSGVKKKFYRVGKTNDNGLIYYTRNCVFEPTDDGSQGIEYTLKQIETAFRWNKIAIISIHRVNFVGGIKVSNRVKGLKRLLNSVIKT